MTKWTKATLVSGHVTYLDLDKATSVKRVRGQGKDYTAVYFGSNVEPFEVKEGAEELLGAVNIEIPAEAGKATGAIPSTRPPQIPAVAL